MSRVQISRSNDLPSLLFIHPPQYQSSSYPRQFLPRTIGTSTDLQSIGSNTDLRSIEASVNLRYLTQYRLLPQLSPLSLQSRHSKTNLSINSTSPSWCQDKMPGDNPHYHRTYERIRCPNRGGRYGCIGPGVNSQLDTHADLYRPGRNYSRYIDGNGRHDDSRMASYNGYDGSRGYERYCRPCDIDRRPRREPYRGRPWLL